MYVAAKSEIDGFVADLLERLQGDVRAFANTLLDHDYSLSPSTLTLAQTRLSYAIRAMGRDLAFEKLMRRVDSQAAGSNHPPVDGEIDTQADQTPQGI